MNMTQPNPFDFPTVREHERETREQGYGPREGVTSAENLNYQPILGAWGMMVGPKPVQEEVKEEEPKPAKFTEMVIEVKNAQEGEKVEKKTPLEEYLSGEFRLIEQTVSNHLKNNSDAAKLEAALAEVEFYKKLIADAKVAWTKAVPHEEFAWDSLIDVGTILSRTPTKE